MPRTLATLTPQHRFLAEGWISHGNPRLLSLLSLFKRDLQLRCPYDFDENAFVAGKQARDTT